MPRPTTVARPRCTRPFAPLRRVARVFAVALLGASLLVAGPIASAREAGARPSTGAVRLPVATFTLPNGLTVLVDEDHTVPLVAVEVWYRVGSKDERPGRTGFAHLFEHLMFQGSAHVGDDEHLRLIAEAGGSANATTSEDRTNFFETVPSNFLERVLFLESDRMGFFVEGIDQKKLDTQRDVVLNERRQSYENRPYGMAPFAIHEAIYPADHPYHWLTIGSPDDLLAATVFDVKGFFKSWYTPRNAIVAIAGDVTLAQAKRLSARYFGDIPSVATPPRADVPKVALEKDKAQTMEDAVSLERTYAVWPSPPWFAPGDAELDLLATVLGGKGGRLYKRLVYELEIAQDVHIAQASARLGSLFEIVATARPGHRAAEVQKVIDEELQKTLAGAPVTDEELARAKNKWEASFVYGLQSLETRADMLDQYEDGVGDAKNGLDRDRRRYVDATAAGVMRAAKAVLSGHRFVLSVVPASKPVPKRMPGPPATHAATGPTTTTTAGAR